jgi:hypothetical protein
MKAPHLTAAETTELCLDDHKPLALIIITTTTTTISSKMIFLM